MPSLTEVDSNGVNIGTLSATSGFNYDAYGKPGDIYRFKVLSMTGSLRTVCPSSGVWYDTINATLPANPIEYVGLDCGTSTAFDFDEHVSFEGRIHVAMVLINVNNAYCIPEDGTLTMSFSPKYEFGRSYPAPSSVSGNVAKWDIRALSSVLSSPFLINVTLFGLGKISLGDTINTSYVVTAANPGEVSTANNTIVRVDTIKSSIDPNYVEVTPSGYIPAGTQLEYTIHFENTGNAAAANIYVMDTLSDYVDMKTMTIEAGSHIMNTTMLNRNGWNVVRFDFPDINLPDSSHHNECDGMLMFNIKTKTGLARGTEILNHAGIYFDDNPVVMTNTAENIIGWPLRVTEVNKESNVVLYPNPATDELTIKTDKDAFSSCIITNNIGQELIRQTLSAASTKINVRRLPAGLYYVILKGSNGNNVQKFVKL